MSVLGVVLEIGASTLVKVHKRKQTIVHLLLVEDQRVLDSEVHGEDDLHQTRSCVMSSQAGSPTGTTR